MNGQKAIMPNLMRQTCRPIFEGPGPRWMGIAPAWRSCCFSHGEPVSSPRGRRLTRRASWVLHHSSTISKVMPDECIAVCMPRPMNVAPSRLWNGYDVMVEKPPCGICVPTKLVEQGQCVRLKTWQAFWCRMATASLSSPFLLQEDVRGKYFVSMSSTRHSAIAYKALIYLCIERRKRYSAIVLQSPSS